MLGTITLTVEQQEPASVTLDMEPSENLGVVQNNTSPKDIAKEDDQTETPEDTDTIKALEEKAESPEQANENQSNEVGFKKVFSFVGFKFTVKKDKNEKPEPVQLLTVKKDEVEVNGIDNHEEHIEAADEGKTDTQMETSEVTNDVNQQAEVENELAESPGDSPNDKQKKTETVVEKDQKSPESPTSSAVTDTSSPFKRFFTQGWAGLRKKTSFKKSREEDPQEVEKHIKSEEQEKPDAAETVKGEETAEKETTQNLPMPEDLSKSACEEVNEENLEIVEEKSKPDESSLEQQEEVKLEETVKTDEGALSIDISPEVEVPTPESNLVSEIKAEVDTLESKLDDQKANGITDICAPPVEEINESLTLVVSEPNILENVQVQLTSSTDSAELEKSQEVFTTEAELLSSQEKAKVQGSPLKKLFSSSGLRKLSGKKRKGKKEDEAKGEVTTEPALVSSESSEAPEADGGDSSPSSPEEGADASPTEKTLDEAPQAAETEGEGTTSDGERKKDGITPWASFKKLVTPKRRPKRPSESDKEDEVDKVKTSTMSSTESAGYAENQEETKESFEEQKLEKSTEENKKKVDTSVSWEALICVGSSKKRARKTSDSDEEEIQQSQEESKKIEEVVQATEIDSDSPITSSQEQQVQEIPSPDQTNSPTDADGGSTWQSFKRLVTPRRKSRTKVEDKTEETAAVANADQSTSEGEAGKEESWVPFRKLIPGRKKKKSDSKQEQTVNNESGQPVNETTEDDYDEPAVVPLAEFDAAEQEKLEAQIALEDSVPGEQQVQLEKHTEELIHAVTVDVIEGERAVTSLEERSPSWISTQVTETIGHAKKTEETTERIKTEVIVEETVVFSTVSQVMTETQHNIINEMELTSEALTALEEAIENSCAEETTEMVSAVSQLGESVVSTEEATPVPEEDASMQNLDEQKKKTDNILHAAAEKATLSIHTLITDSSNNEIITDTTQNMQYQVTGITLEDHPFIEEKHVSITKQSENAAISVVEQTAKSLPVNTYADDKEVASIAAEEHTNEPSSLIEEIAIKQKTNENVTVISDVCTLEIAPNLTESQAASISFANATDKDNTFDVPMSQVEEFAQQEESALGLVEDVSKNVMLASSTEHDKDFPPEGQFHENISVLENVCPGQDIPSGVEVETESDITFFEIKKTFSALATEQVEEAASFSSDVKDEESVSFVTEVQPDENILEVKPEESVPSVSEVQLKESVLTVPEVQSEEIVVSVFEVKPEEIVSLVSEESTSPVPEAQHEENVSPAPEAQDEEIVPPVSKTQPEESISPVPEAQPEETFSPVLEVHPEESGSSVPEIQHEESVLPVLEAQSRESVSPVLEAHPEESVTLVPEVMAEKSVSPVPEAQPEKSVLAMLEDQLEETVSPVHEAQHDKNVSSVTESQLEESVSPVPEESFPEVKTEESVPEVQPEESVPKLHTEEDIPSSSEVQAEESIPEVQAEESIPEVQAEESIPEVKTEESVPVVQTEESVPEVQTEESVFIMQTEESVLEVQPVESVPEVQTEESVPRLQTEESVLEVQPVESVPEVQTEESVLRVQTEESVLEVRSVETVPEVQTKESVPEVQTKESVLEVQTEESVPVVQPVESVPEVQAEESAPEVQAKESVPEVQVKESDPEVEAEDSVPDLHKEDSVPDLQKEDSVPEVQKEDSVPEVQKKESVPEMQKDESVPEVQIEESVPEVQPVEGVPEVQPVVGVPKVKPVEVVLEVQPVESILEVQTKENVPEVQSEEYSLEVQTKENLLSVSEGQSEANVNEVQPDERITDHIITEQEVAEVKEEVVTSDIAEFESLEASNLSEPITAAEVEEQVLSETVKPIEETVDSIELVLTADNTRSNVIEEVSYGQTVVESVSQKAAAIVDAAIEAATNCFVVDATGDTNKETPVTENGDLTTETVVQSICIESHSTTIVQNIIESAMEKVVGIVNENVSVTQGQSQKNEFLSQVHENIQEISTYTGSSEVNTQEKSQTVES